MSNDTLHPTESPSYSENYRGFAIELRQSGGQWYAKTTAPVQWVTPTRRSWLSALFELYALVDRYQRAQMFCQLNRLQAPAAGAVEFTGQHLAVDTLCAQCRGAHLVGACPLSPSAVRS